MIIKRNAAFRLFAYGKDKNRYQIRFRVTFNSQRLDLKTGCRLNNKSAWDEESQLVKPGYRGPKGEPPCPSTMSFGISRTRWILPSSSLRPSN